MAAKKITKTPTKLPKPPKLPKSGGGGKKRSDTYHHGDLRRALLDAARIELHKVGAQELSLRGVARRAGVTHTAAYHHFADKDALLRRVAQEGFEKLDACMVASIATAAPDDDAFEKMKLCGLGYLRFAKEDPQALQLMFNGQHHDDTDIALEEAGQRAFMRLVESVVAVRTQAGLDGDPIPDAILHWSFVHGYAALGLNDSWSYFGITDTTQFGGLLHGRLIEIYGAASIRAAAARKESAG